MNEWSKEYEQKKISRSEGNKRIHKYKSFNRWILMWACMCVYGSTTKWEKNINTEFILHRQKTSERASERVQPTKRQTSDEQTLLACIHTHIHTRHQLEMNGKRTNNTKNNTDIRGRSKQIWMETNVCAFICAHTRTYLYIWQYSTHKTIATVQLSMETNTCNHWNLLIHKRSACNGW